MSYGLHEGRIINTIASKYIVELMLCTSAKAIDAPFASHA